MGPSEAEPEEGDIFNHDSETLVDQSLFAVNKMVPLPPSEGSETIVDPVRVNSGAFWQEHKPITKRDSSIMLYNGRIISEFEKIMTYNYRTNRDSVISLCT